MHACMCVCVCAHVYVSVRPSICGHAWHVHVLCVCACACVLCACGVCVCVCVCLCMCCEHVCVHACFHACVLFRGTQQNSPPTPNKKQNPKEAVYIIIDVSILLQACAAFLYLPSLYSLPTALTLLVGACSCFSRSSSPISFSTLKQKSTFCIVLVLGKSQQKPKHSPQCHVSNAVV